MRLTRLVILGAIIATSAFIGCGKDGVQAPPAADPGFVAVRLTTPNANDGAIRFAIAGGPIDSLRSTAGNMFSTSDQTGARVIVAGSPLPNPILRFWMPDRNTLSTYTATIQEAAATTYTQQSLQGYTLTLQPE